MNKKDIQPPSAVVMVRPHYFEPNPQTAADNKFQVEISRGEKAQAAQRAYDQVTNAASILEIHGVTVHLFDDETRITPDSVFPNNWFTTHHDGTLITYPMYAENRRLERRQDIIDTLASHYKIKKYIDYSLYEREGLFLEGTGAMVLDHQARIAYVVNSHRADIELLTKFCRDMDFKPFMFDAHDEDAQPIYHTNVMMCAASDFALVGLDTLTCGDERKSLIDQLEYSGRKVIPLKNQQIHGFAGNALELSTKDGGRILAMSETAFGVLNAEQREVIEDSAKIVAINVDALEMAGGSLRCMLADIHLSPK